MHFSCNFLDKEQTNDFGRHIRGQYERVGASGRQLSNGQRDKSV